MKKLLIVWHSMTGGSEALARAAFAGAQEVEAVLLRADETTAVDVREADGYLFVFPENLAAISGVMKAFFDRCYYPCLRHIEGRPYAAIICAGSDGSNAMRQMERIATGWRLKKVADSIIICTHAQTPEEILAAKTIGQPDLEEASTLGATIAAGMAMGVF
jgi:multimeric flavodoxin WrbA